MPASRPRVVLKSDAAAGFLLGLGWTEGELSAQARGPDRRGANAGGGSRRHACI